MADAPQSSAPSAESQAVQSTQQSTQSSAANQQVQAVAQDAAATIADPNASQAQKVQAQKTLKQIKIKFNGRDYDEALPFEIPDTAEARDYMTKQLQMSRLAQTKSQEKADLDQRVTNFINELKKNPRKVLEDKSIGVDVKKLAAELIEEEIANSKKSPDQLQREQLQREVKELKEQREREFAAAQEKERQMAVEYNMQKYDLEITKAFENTDLPKNAYMAKRVADYQYLALKDLKYELPAEDALALVREDVMEELKSMFGAMPEEVLEQFVGKNNFDRVRKKKLAKSKNAPVPVRSSLKDTATVREKKEAPKAKMNYKDFFKV